MLAWFLLFLFLRLCARNRANCLVSECLRKAVLACLLLFLLLRLHEGNRANHLASERLRKVGEKEIEEAPRSEDLMKVHVRQQVSIKKYGSTS